MNVSDRLFDTMGNMLMTSTLIILIIICLAILWLWCIYDMAKSEFHNGADKITWCILLSILAPIGTIMYLLLSNKQKREEVIYRNMAYSKDDDLQEPKPY